MKIRSHSAILFVCVVILVAILTGCAEVSAVSKILDQGGDASNATPEAQPDSPVTIMVVEPTPTPVPEVERISQILFVSDRSPAGTRDIYLINSDGSGLIQLTTHAADDFDPALSPDWQQIAFTSTRNGTRQIYLLNLGTMEVTKLTDHPGGATSPTWSPDGEQIAFVEPSQNSDTIFLINSQGGGEVTKIQLEARSINDLAWGPKGNVIAFSAIPKGPGYKDHEILTYDLNTKTLVNLTNSPGDDSRPAWAIGGDKLVFQSSRDGNPDIFVMRSDGSLQTRLTNHTESDVEPTWSSDGRHIAFSSNREGYYDLYLMTDSGADQKPLAVFDADDRQPHWAIPPAPVLDELAFAARASQSEFFNIYRASASETEIGSDENSDETMPDWSPDGTRLAFASNRSGNYEIYITNADGSGEPLQLTDRPGSDMNPDWSPDGSQIAFESKLDTGSWNIWIMKTDGSEMRNITQNLPGDQGNPAWSPDGKQIAFSSNIGSDFDIYLINADGSGGVEQLTSLQGNEFYPSWSPDGNLIVFRGTSLLSDDRQIFVVDRNGRGARQLFSSTANDDTPAWSPDGQKIAFVSDRANPGSRYRPGQYDLYVYDISSKAIEVITQGDQDVRYPDWKPQKQRLTP